MTEVTLLGAAALTLMTFFIKFFLIPKLRWKKYLKFRKDAESILANSPSWEKLMKYADVYFDELRSEDNKDYGFSVFDHELHRFEQLLKDGYAVRNIAGIQEDIDKELAHMERLVENYKEIITQDNILKNGIWNALIDSKRNLIRIIEKGVDEFTRKETY